MHSLAAARASSASASGKPSVVALGVTNQRSTPPSEVARVMRRASSGSTLVRAGVAYTSVSLRMSTRRPA